MGEAFGLERSVATALEINQKEIDHLIVLKQLRRTIEEALGKPSLEQLGAHAPAVEIPWGKSRAA
jgi:hypothetical protein